ncbi:unnamed protein product [Peniophora sp. CBMAI 1063]|nr:unnamed protein product [Peniophora sp. CBMAI 1063]
MVTTRSGFCLPQTSYGLGRRPPKNPSIRAPAPTKTTSSDLAFGVDFTVIGAKGPEHPWHETPEPNRRERRSAEAQERRSEREKAKKRKREEERRKNAEISQKTANGWEQHSFPQRVGTAARMEVKCADKGFTNSPDDLRDADTLFDTRSFILNNPDKGAFDKPLVIRYAVEESLANRWHRIPRIWKRMVSHLDSRCRFKHSAKERDKNRSSTSAGHIGCWSHSAKEIFVTHDSWDQTPSVKAELKKLCTAVTRDISPTIGFIQERYLPNQHDLVKRARKALLANGLARLKEQPYLDFETFLCMAIKFGSSEIWHLDHKDDRRLMAFVVPLGKWEGKAMLCFPQLGMKVDVKHGEIIAFLSNTLVHWSTLPESGERCVLTCFVDGTYASRF